MKLVLRSDVEGVGNKGDIVEVADGYGRNYLVPRGLAIRATEGSTAQAEAMQRARSVLDAQQRTEAQEVASRLVPTAIVVTARAGDEGKLFGSVTTVDVAQAVLDQTGIELDRRQLHLDEPIKTLGTHEVAAKLHTEVQFPITVEVVEG